MPAQGSFLTIFGMYRVSFPPVAGFFSARSGLANFLRPRRVSLRLWRASFPPVRGLRKVLFVPAQGSLVTAVSQFRDAQGFFCPWRVCLLRIPGLRKVFFATAQGSFFTRFGGCRDSVAPVESSCCCAHAGSLFKPFLEGRGVSTPSCLIILEKWFVLVDHAFSRL